MMTSPRANWISTRTQLISSGRWKVTADVGADTGERRQKANAVLIRFLSWTRLLGASVSSERMGRNRDSVKFSDEVQFGKFFHFQSFWAVQRQEKCWIALYDSRRCWLDSCESG
jgi:hypothetical protein